ncbi:MAG TPA: VWA domain-containing protein [Pyrinomonadaceae bacterium]
MSFPFSFLLLVFAVFGQKPSAKVAGKDVTKPLEVRLPLTITDATKKLVVCGKEREKNGNKDKKAAPVRCFKKNDFIVLEDGVRQKIKSFTDIKTAAPLYIGVLMDTSAAAAEKMTFSKRAVSDFIYTVVRLRKDKAAFMTFDNEINLIQDFTDKIDLLDKAVDKVKVDKVKKAGSQTALYDAIWQFADEKLRNVPGRRVMVVISDGDDTVSRAELNDAIDIARRTETTIFGIFTREAFPGTLSGQAKADNFLTRLCRETGGEAFFVSDMSALERPYANIITELQSPYIITYRPKNQNYDGRIRKIEVRFRKQLNTGKFKIRSKTEYRSVRGA